jgi:hypothetical protein
MKSFVQVLGAAILVFASIDAVGAVKPAAIQQGAAQVSPADAAPFLGEWTLALQGPNGPGTFLVSITADKDKVSGEISSDTLAKTPFGAISLSDKSLLLGFTFNYEGNPVDAVVSLTPDKEGKTAAQIDFAGGAYVMTGAATKKEKDKEFIAERNW